MSEKKKLAVPFDRSYRVVPGKLLAAHYPGASSRNEAQKKLGGLLNLGIHHVLNLMEPDEYDHSENEFVRYESVMQCMAESRGLEVSFDWMPIEDMSVPTEAGTVYILDRIGLYPLLGRPGANRHGGGVLSGEAWHGNWW